MHIESISKYCLFFLIQGKDIGKLNTQNAFDACSNTLKYIKILEKEKGK